MNTAHPLLFDSPKTHRTALEVWKERHGVTTDPIQFPELAGGDTWRAFTWPSDNMAHGISEEAACEALADKMGLPFLESISEQERRLP